MTRIPISIVGVADNCLDLEFESEDIAGCWVADRGILTINATIKCAPSTYSQVQAAKARLFDLGGVLYAENDYTDPGAPLRAFRLDQPGIPYLGQMAFQFPLRFELTRAYLQHLEEYRLNSSVSPGANMQLKLKLWGTVTIASTAGDNAGAAVFGSISTSGYPETKFRIPRSDWLDRVLPSLGYDQTLLVEIPRPRHPTAPDELKEASQYLQLAQQHLRDEKYREAVQNCRQAKDALLKRNADGLKNLLAPWVGETKAATADSALGAFNRLYTAASHPKTRADQERVEFTRDDAAFAVNSLAFILDYIARVLGTQSVAE